ncbi:MAG: hypothetical protein ABH849_03790 [Nanoarchaeota archaeon]
MRIDLTEIDCYFLDLGGDVTAYYFSHGVEPAELDEWRKWNHAPLRVIGYVGSSDTEIIFDGSLDESQLIPEPKIGLHPVFVSKRGIRVSKDSIKALDEHFELPKSASR